MVLSELELARFQLIGARKRLDQAREVFAEAVRNHDYALVQWERVTNEFDNNHEVK
jgi:hypothetical protein